MQQRAAGIFCAVNVDEELEILGYVATDIERAIARLDLLYGKCFPDWLAKECQARLTLANAGLFVKDIVFRVRQAIEDKEVTRGTESDVRPGADSCDE